MTLRGSILLDMAAAHLTRHHRRIEESSMSERPINPDEATQEANCWDLGTAVYHCPDTTPRHSPRRTCRPPDL